MYIKYVKIDIGINLGMDDVKKFCPNSWIINFRLVADFHETNSQKGIIFIKKLKIKI